MNEHRNTNVTDQDQSRDEINLLELFGVIVKRKMLIIVICSVSIALAVCYSLTLKNVYTATSKFFPPQKESPLSSFASLLVQTGPLQTLGGLGGAGDLYLGIFKSRTVADAVVKRLELQKVKGKIVHPEIARSMAMGAVKATLGKDGIITVSATSRDPKKAALLANAFVDETIKRSVELYITKAGAEKYFLEKRLETVKVDLTTAENDLKTFQEKHKTIKADGQASIAVDGIAKLRAEIVSKEVQLATLRNSMTDESSEVKALSAGIARLKSQLGAMSGRGGGDTIIPAAGNIPGIGMEYARKVRELKIQEVIFEQLSKQYEMAKVNEKKESSSVQVIDEAVEPLRKSGPRRSLLVIAAAISSFMISIVIILLQEYFSKMSAEDSKVVSEIKQSLCFWRRKPGK